MLVEKQVSLQPYNSFGIAARAERLARGLDAAGQSAIAAAHRRLTDPSEMGSLFQALALVPPGAPLPPGFEAAQDRNAP